MAPTLSLDAFPAGSRVRIKKLCACPSMRGRLCSLGLTPGATVEMCGALGGTCRLKVRGADVVLTEGVACSVFGAEDCDSERVLDCEQRAGHCGGREARHKSGCKGGWFSAFHGRRGEKG